MDPSASEPKFKENFKEIVVGPLNRPNLSTSKGGKLEAPACPVTRRLPLRSPSRGTAARRNHQIDARQAIGLALRGRRRQRRREESGRRGERCRSPGLTVGARRPAFAGPEHPIDCSPAPSVKLPPAQVVGVRNDKEKLDASEFDGPLHEVIPTKISIPSAEFQGQADALPICLVAA